MVRQPPDFDGEFIDKPGLMQIAPAAIRILIYAYSRRLDALVRHLINTL
jgi:hypothetical protein